MNYRKDSDNKVSVDWDKPTHCEHPIGRIVVDGKVKKVSCKLWSCPFCQKAKKQAMIKRFEHYKNAYPYIMLTLTEWKHPSNKQNSQKLTQHWARLRASLRKHKIKMTNFFWVKEYKPLYHKNWRYTEEQNAIKYPHMHVLIPNSIDRNLIKRLWYLATVRTSKQIHIPKNEVLINNAPAYLTKYVTKSSFTGFSKKERRFGFSRNFKAQPKAYKYLKRGKVRTYIPFISDKSNLFFLNSTTVSDEVLLRIELIYKSLIQAWHLENPEGSQLYIDQKEQIEHYNEELQDVYEYIDDELLDKGINYDFIIEPPAVVMNPGIPSAKQKIPFILKNYNIKKEDVDFI